MWIRSVTAHAFGDLTTKKLDLQPGLNVIVGDNETGKSTWHAAIFAALCGYRPESGSAADAALAERRPRRAGNTEWSVRADVVLDDGRDVRISRNLVTSTATAVDLATGSDVTQELSSVDGLDAARWFGLNRRLFAATGYVEQGKLLATSAGTSGESLRRLVTTDDDMQTAEQALDRIARYRARAVGAVSDKHTPIGRALAGFFAADDAERRLTALRDEAAVKQRELAEADRALQQLDQRLGVAKLLAAQADLLDAEAALSDARARQTATSVDSGGLAADAVEQAAAWYHHACAELERLRSVAAAQPPKEPNRRLFRTKPAPPRPSRNPTADQQRVVTEAEQALRNALVAAGIIPAAHEQVLETLERYRDQVRARALDTPGEPSIVDLENRLVEAQARVRDLQRYAPSWSAAAYVVVDDDQPTEHRPIPYGTPGYYQNETPPAQPLTPPEIAALDDVYEQDKQKRCDAQADLDRCRDEIRDAEADMPRHEAARTEFRRLERLDRILDQAVGRLRAAQTAIHRQLAIDLERRLGEWVVDVTANRYTSVRVDNESLSVYLGGPHEPEVDALLTSHGAAEQVRLLLRLALFHNRCAGGPLLLDDVLAHASPRRARAVVGLLAKLVGRDNQVVLFTTHEIADFPVWRRLTSTRENPVA